MGRNAAAGRGSVPAYPASHGCVRVSLGDADWLYARVGIGTPVNVHD
jgi:lipoprotein-anchoring transpeptidase ErfK/SrfK